MRDGGIDLSEKANPAVWDLVNEAKNVWVPQQIAGMGGWKAAMGHYRMYSITAVLAAM